MYDLWRTEAHGILSAEVGDFRLVVQAPQEVGGFVRYMVLFRATLDNAERLICSGSKENVRAAMRAAEETASRYGTP